MAARKTSTRSGRSRSRQPRKQTKSRTPRTQSTSKTLASQLGKVIALVLVLGLVLVIERYCSVEIEPFGPDAKIVSIDGDTLRAANGDEYRIFGIDAPELNQSCQEANGKPWACGRAAKVKLTKLIQAGGVTCEVRDKDRYGRNVAHCSAEGVLDLGAVMVRDGYAVDLGRKTGYAYADIEADARAGKRGMWRGTFERPADWRYANPRRD